MIFLLVANQNNFHSLLSFEQLFMIAMD